MAFLADADFSVCFQMEEKHERHTPPEKWRRFTWPSFLPLSDFSIFFSRIPSSSATADKRLNKNRSREKKPKETRRRRRSA